MEKTHVRHVRIRSELSLFLQEEMKRYKSKTGNNITYSNFINKVLKSYMLDAKFIRSANNWSQEQKSFPVLKKLISETD